MYVRHPSIMKLMKDTLHYGNAFRSSEFGYRLRREFPFNRSSNEADLQDDEIDIIYAQLEAEFGEVTYQGWLALLVSDEWNRHG